MTKEEMAKKLYEIIANDTFNASDADVSLFESQVMYKDQGGYIGVDFNSLTLTNRGQLNETFCCDSKIEFAQNYIDANTINVEFYEKYGSTYVSLSRQFKSLDDLFHAMSEFTLFVYIDLRGLLKDN